MKRFTLTAHAGSHTPVPNARPHAPPIYQTAGFEYDSAADAEAGAFDKLYIYARNASPTEDALGQVIARLEGAESAVVFGSGMGAIAAALEAYLGAGGHLATVDGLYGGSHELVSAILPRFGVTHSFAESPTAEAIAQVIKPETRAVFVESLSNPLLRVADLDAVAALCKSRGLPLLVDATFATPLLQRPIERGATLSIHSATKYLCGHGDAMGGVVSGATTEIAKVKRMRKFHGANCDPFGAWLILRGVRTLSLRVAQAVASATRIAAALESMPGIERVLHPSLKSHPDHALAQRMLDGPGAMIAFEVTGGEDRARGVYDRIKLIARAASLGDVTSLMTHPARFSHVHVERAARLRAGITDGLLRLSVGIEDPQDLIDDLRHAMS